MGMSRNSATIYCLDLLEQDYDNLCMMMIRDRKNGLTCMIEAMSNVMRTS